MNRMFEKLMTCDEDGRRGRRRQRNRRQSSSSRRAFPFGKALRNEKGSAPARALRDAALALARSEINAIIFIMSLTYRWPILECLRGLRVLQIACKQQNGDSACEGSAIFQASGCRFTTSE